MEVNETSTNIVVITKGIKITTEKYGATIALTLSQPTKLIVFSIHDAANELVKKSFIQSNNGDQVNHKIPNQIRAPIKKGRKVNHNTQGLKIPRRESTKERMMSRIVQPLKVKDAQHFFKAKICCCKK